jgi:hypothetical protein
MVGIVKNIVSSVEPRKSDVTGQVSKRRPKPLLPQLQMLATVSSWGLLMSHHRSNRWHHQRQSMRSM